MTDEEREMIQKWLKARCSAQDCDLSDCKAVGCDFAICVRFASYGLAMADLLHEHARLKNCLSGMECRSETAELELNDLMEQIVSISKHRDALKADFSNYRRNHEQAILPALRRRLNTLESELAAFRKKWADRFGFIQSEHPADSIESIDAVANVLNNDSEKNV